MFTFFYSYKSNPKTCFLSQWFPRVFYDEYKNRFTSAEQYMMFYKAQLFQDYQIAERILQSNNPKIIKELGRKVKNFDEQTWNKHKKKIVLKGNYLKFTQNSDLLQKLIETKNDLVEASPYDKIWGIGFDEKNALNNKDRWGQNLLGKILTKLRDKLQ